MCSCYKCILILLHIKERVQSLNNLHKSIRFLLYAKWLGQNKSNRLQTQTSVLKAVIVIFIQVIVVQLLVIIPVQTFVYFFWIHFRFAVCFGLSVPQIPLHLRTFVVIFLDSHCQYRFSFILLLNLCIICNFVFKCFLFKLYFLQFFL